MFIFIRRDEDMYTFGRGATYDVIIQQEMT
jgi:hypothetical protein